MRVLILIVLTVFFSCSSTKEVEKPVKELVDDAMETLSFDVIAEGNNSGFTEKENVVINNTEELDRAWGKAFENYTRKKPIPIIDFEKQAVLLVTMGEKSNGGFSTKVESVIGGGGNIIVNIIESQPGSSCVNPSVLVYPYQIITIEKSSKNKIAFKTTEKIYDCEK